MDAYTNQGSPLSRRETGLLARWERSRQFRVGLDEIRALVGERNAKNVVKGLLRKGVLSRAGRGQYFVRPLRSQLRPTLTSSPVVLAAILHDRAYYLGGSWAFAQHGLTTQVYGGVLDAYVTTKLKPRRVGNAEVRFHRIPARHMDLGIVEIEIEGSPVRISDRERTVLDALDHPRTVGGVRRAMDWVERALDQVQLSTLVGYAVKGAKPSTCQRLGVLLERAKVPPAKLTPLRARTRTSGSLLSMLPDSRRKGRVNTTWNVVENDR